jgi:hypothetical protein
VVDWLPGGGDAATVVLGVLLGYVGKTFRVVERFPVLGA